MPLIISSGKRAIVPLLGWKRPFENQIMNIFTVLWFPYFSLLLQVYKWSFQAVLVLVFVCWLTLGSFITFVFFIRRNWSSSMPRVTNKFQFWRMTWARHAASRSSYTNMCESLNKPMTTWKEPRGPNEMIYNFSKLRILQIFTYFCACCCLKIYILYF